MCLPTLEDIDCREKRVLVRLDFDFLFESGFDIYEGHKFGLLTPTINKLIEENARIVIAGSYSRIKDEKRSEYSMEQFADIFCKSFGCEVYLTEERIGQVANKLSHDMVPGSILILNNFYGLHDDKGNKPSFAKSMSELSDIYINEAISLSHMELSSTNLILDYFERGEVCFGSSFINEYSLMKILTNNTAPSALFINTDSVNECLEIIENFIDDINKIFLTDSSLGAFSNSEETELKTDLVPGQKNRIDCVLKSLDARDVELLGPVDYFVKENDGNIVQVSLEGLKKKQHCVRHRKKYR